VKHHSGELPAVGVTLVALGYAGFAWGIARAREKALELAADAVTELEGVPPSPFRDALCDLAVLSVERKS